MKIIDDADKCCGCEACANICAVGAITMVKNEEGFKYPKIDDEACINCERCAAICPVNHPNYQNNQNPQCFAVAASDVIRAKSASGGAFTAMAKWVLDEGGAVCGAAYDQDWSVKHVVVEQKADLEQLKGSKYAESRIDDCFAKVKELCRQKRKVLFSGTPCQVAGLKAFLGRDYANLFCVDLICHGVPSAKVLQKALSEYTNGAKVYKLDMRDKSQGWMNEYRVNVNDERVRGVDFPFIMAFARNLCLRKSCGDCPFARLPRQGDITIGDFWGVDKYYPDYNDRKGTSVAVVNNDKGKALLEAIKNRLGLCEEVPLEKVHENNYNLIKSSSHNCCRSSFFADLEKVTVAENVTRCARGHFDAAILNYWPYSNFGAMLTGYALQETLKAMGVSNKSILYMNNGREKHRLSFFNTSQFKRFADKYMNYTVNVEYEDLVKLNDVTENFIVGSDQVWRPSIQGDYKDAYYLSFAAEKAKKIACAASFGLEEYAGSEDEKNEAAFLLKDFDAISMREYDGQKILRDWGIDSEVLLDPVFWADRKVYDKVADKYKPKKGPKKFVFLYGFNYKEEHRKVARYYAQKLGTEVVESDSLVTPVEAWLYYIKNAEMIVTNSFHGVCFSLIYNKNFVCTADKNQAYSRFETLYKFFDIKGRTKAIMDLFAEENFEPAPLDYDKINRQIKEGGEQGRKWLQHALTKKRADKLSPQDKILRRLIYQSSANANRARKIFEANEGLEKLLTDKITKVEEMLRLVGKYRKIKRRYYRYRLLAAITWGKKRQKYNKKRRACKELVKKIRSFLKGS